MISFPSLLSFNRKPWLKLASRTGVDCRAFRSGKSVEEVLPPT